MSTTWDREEKEFRKARGDFHAGDRETVALSGNGILRGKRCRTYSREEKTVSSRESRILISVGKKGVKKTRGSASNRNDFLTRRGTLVPRGSENAGGSRMGNSVSPGGKRGDSKDEGEYRAASRKLEKRYV